MIEKISVDVIISSDWLAQLEIHQKVNQEDQPF